MNDRALPESILDRIASKGLMARRITLRDAYGDAPTDVMRRSGRYEILGEIASGGVGVVLRARDIDLGRDVAIKVLHDRHLDNPELIQRLIEEAQIGGQLQHPAIVPVYEIALDERRVPFIAMKLVKGRTLTALLQDRENPRSELRRFLARFLKACQAMAYAHSRGVVHRDLKPSNLMVGSYGEVMILDWGFAKVLARGGVADEKRATVYRDDVTRIETLRSGHSEMTSREGSLMGTPAYMPPEQALGQIDDLDTRSDVFSLGAILCEILTGIPPYGNDSQEVLTKAACGDLNDAFKRLDASESDQGLVEVCKRCLAPLRRDRHKNAGVLSDAIASHLDEMAVRARRLEMAAIRQRERAAKAKADAMAQRAAAQAARTQAEEERARAQKAHAEEVRERTAAIRARKARKQLVAIAISLVAVVVLGGGGYLIHTRAEAERLRTLRATVQDRVLNAQRLRSEGKGDEAVVAARQAVDAGRKGGADAETIARAEALIREVEEEQKAREAEEARQRRQLMLTAALERCRARRSEIFDAEETGALYTGALEAQGIDIKSDGSDVERSIRTLPDPSVAIAALDDLAWLRGVRLGADPGTWGQPLEAAARADTDRWRTDLRNYARLRNAGAVTDAAAIDPASLSADSARLVAIALELVGEPDKAAAYLVRAQIVHAGDPWMLGLLLHHGLRTGSIESEAAMRYANALVTLRPALAELRVELALFQGSAGSHAAAMADCREALRLEPDLPEAHAVQAQLLEWSGDRERALAAWRAAIALDPESVWVRLRFGLALLHNGDAGAALGELRRAAALRPGDPDIQLATAKAAYTAGDLSAARAAAKAAENMRPDDPQVQRVLGLVFLKAGHDVDAGRHLEKAATLAPEDPFVQNALGLLYFERGDLARAQAAFTRAGGGRGPPRAAARANLGRLWLERRDNEACVRMCRSAIEESERGPATPWLDGYTLSGETPLNQAVEVLREVVKRNPAYAYAHHWLAIGLRKQGQYMSAIRACKEALDADPEYGFCMQTLAWIYTTCSVESYRDPKRALELARRIATLQGHPPDEAAQILGVALYRSGEFEEAAQALQRSNASQAGGNAWNWYFLAMARWKLGNPDTARRWLAKANAWTAENDPTNPQLLRFREEAERLVRPE